MVIILSRLSIYYYIVIIIVITILSGGIQEYCEVVATMCAILNYKQVIYNSVGAVPKMQNIVSMISLLMSKYRLCFIYIFYNYIFSRTFVTSFANIIHETFV